MNTSTRIIATLWFAAILTACGKDDPANAAQAPDTEPKTALGKVVNNAIDEARQQLAKENVGLSTSDGEPKAEITPVGDLLIDGKAVAIDEKQRALLLEYRKRIHAVAEAGMAIGKQGADLAGKAIGQAFGSVLSGDSGEMEKRMEAEGKKIEANAMKLCELMPALFDAQNAAAESLPAFKPYARMTQKDVEDCRTGSTQGGHSNAITQAIESAFNEKLDIKVDIDTSAKEGMSAAEEAEAAGQKTEATKQ
jgi:hypothetical protein